MNCVRTVWKVSDGQAAERRLIRATVLPVEEFLKLDPLCDLVTASSEPGGLTPSTVTGGRISRQGPGHISAYQDTPVL